MLLCVFSCRCSNFSSLKILSPVIKDEIGRKLRPPVARSNGRKSFEIRHSAKFLSKSFSAKSVRCAMLDPIPVFLCIRVQSLVLWSQTPVRPRVCPPQGISKYPQAHCAQTLPARERTIVLDNQSKRKENFEQKRAERAETATAPRRYTQKQGM